MLYADVNGSRVEATPQSTGKCPLCGDSVFSKCGSIKVWHWAHQREKSCDDWYEPETEWHKRWKMVFGKENCEVILESNGVKHIADVLTQNKVIIELQSSPISTDTVRERELFYGENMMWIINGAPFKDNFSFQEVLLPFGQRWYWRNDVEKTEFGFVDKSTGELKIPPEKVFTYSWRWPHKSWSKTMRKIFIDFGDENLFQIISGIGENHGKGKTLLKESFLTDHHGKIELLETLISKESESNKNQLE